MNEGQVQALAQVAGRLKVSKTFVVTWVRRFKTDGNVNVLPGTGSSVSITKAQSKVIIDLFTKFPTLFLSTQREKLRKETTKVSCQAKNLRIRTVSEPYAKMCKLGQGKYWPWLEQCTIYKQIDFFNCRKGAWLKKRETILHFSMAKPNGINIPGSN